MNSMQNPDEIKNSNGQSSSLDPSSTNLSSLNEPLSTQSLGDATSDVRHPVDELADEFSMRCRCGETPSIEEYENRAPEFRDMIRSLFPTIARIERMSSHTPTKHRESRQVLPEDKVIGDFKIVREIGRGGMGIVYEAIQRSLDRRVALKVLSSGIANSPSQLQRFRREAEAAARLHHTNIVPVYGIGEENGVHYYAMQFIDGVPLTQAIETARQNSSVRSGSVFDPTDFSSSSEPLGNTGVVPAHQAPAESDISDPTILMSPPRQYEQPAAPDQGGKPLDSEVSTTFETNTRGNARPITVTQRASRRVTDSEIKSISRKLLSQSGHLAYFQHVAHLTEQVAEALDYAHQHGVLHRDVKPSNLMLDQSGMVWIMDFGLVKILEQQDLTQAGEIVGTLRYMAPEQLEGRANAKSDIYGLGLTLYELVTLKPAFDGDRILTLGQRVQQNSIPRPRSINPAIPRDLETIILKATAHDASARYATGAAMAEDLRRFCEDRPILARRATILEQFWRWSRRNPALAMATGTSLILLATISVVMTVSRLRVASALLDSKTAQHRAEKNLFSAIEAFDSILDNVTSRGLPRSMAQNISEAEMGLMQTPLSKADALLLDRLLEFYRQFAAENAENVTLRARIADAYERAASIQLRLGRLDEAEADYRTAIASLNKIHQADPLNVDVVVKIASLYNELGKLSLRLGDFYQTILAHLEARALLLEQPATMRSHPTLRFELARSTVLLASIDVRSGTDSGPGLPPPDRPDHAGPPSVDGPPPRPSDDQRRRLHPQPPDRQRLGSGPGPGGPRRGQSAFDELSERLRNAMPKVFKPGEPVGIGLATILKEACDELRELVKETPDNDAYQFRLAQTLRIQLVNSATAGDAQTARQSFLEGRSLLNQLVAKYPDDPKYLFEQASTMIQASRAESDDDARDSLERGVELGRQLFERFPSATEYQLLYGTALARLASNQAARNLRSDSEKNLSRSIEVLTPLAQQFPDQGIIQIPLAKTCQQLGDLLRTMADEDSANSQCLERSRKELQTAIDRFETYLSAPNETSKSTAKGMFNMETHSSLYKSLAQTLTQMQLPEQAEQARSSATRYSWPIRPPRSPSP